MTNFRKNPKKCETVRRIKQVIKKKKSALLLYIFFEFVDNVPCVYRRQTSARPHFHFPHTRSNIFHVKTKIAKQALFDAYFKKLTRVKTSSLPRAAERAATGRRRADPPEPNSREVARRLPRCYRGGEARSTSAASVGAAPEREPKPKQHKESKLRHWGVHA